MRLPQTNCPNCNSRQRFSPKKRELDGNIETYARCLMCKREIRLSVIPKQQKLRRKRVVRERMKVR